MQQVQHHRGCVTISVLGRGLCHVQLGLRCCHRAGVPPSLPPLLILAAFGSAQLPFVLAQLSSPPGAPSVSLTVSAFLSSYTPPTLPAVPPWCVHHPPTPSLSDTTHPPPPAPASSLARSRCRKAGLILSQLGDLSSWCNGLLQEPKISLQRSSLKYLACRYSEIKPYGLDWSELSRDLKKTCEEQTLTVLYNDYGDKDY